MQSRPAKIHWYRAVVPLQANGSTAAAVQPPGPTAGYIKRRARSCTARGYRATGSTARFASGSTAWTVPVNGSTAKRRTFAPKSFGILEPGFSLRTGENGTVVPLVQRTVVPLKRYYRFTEAVLPSTRDQFSSLKRLDSRGV